MTTGADGDQLELLESRWSALLGGAPGLALAWTALALGPGVRTPWTVGPAVVVTAAWLPLALLAQRRRRGVRLTRAGITVRGLRTRRFAWSDVEGFEVHDSRVKLLTRRGDRITLPLPARSWRDRSGFERDADLVLDWWHAHGSVHRGQAAEPGYPWQPTPTSPDPWAPPPT